MIKTMDYAQSADTLIAVQEDMAPKKLLEVDLILPGPLVILVLSLYQSMHLVYQHQILQLH